MTIPAAEINYFAVLLAAIADMVIGSFWYSNFLFGKPWRAAMKKTEEEWEDMQKNAGPAYVTSTFAAIVMAFVLAHFIYALGAETFVSGIQTAFWLWLGFLAAGMISAYFFEDRSKKLYIMYVGYKLVALLVMGVILAVWQ